MAPNGAAEEAADGSTAAVGVPAAGCRGVGDMFEELPDDLVVSILADVATSARSPGGVHTGRCRDVRPVAGAMLTCKRFRDLGQSKVLARVSPRCLAVRAKSWSDSAHRFMQLCADAGNLDACYLLGMIRFYCLGSRGSGAALMAAAAVGGHREALYLPSSNGAAHLFCGAIFLNSFDLPRVDKGRIPRVASSGSHP